MKNFATKNKSSKISFGYLRRVILSILMPVLSLSAQNNLVLSDVSTKWTGDGNIMFVFEDVGIRNNASPSVFSGAGRYRFIGNSASSVSGSFSTVLRDVEIAKSGSAALELNQNLTVAEHVLISSGVCQIHDQTLSIGKNFTNQGFFYSGQNGTLAFSGTDHSLITMNSNSDVLANLRVEKTAGAELKLESSVQVGGEVVFVSGNLHLNNWGLDLGTTGLLMNETDQARIYCDCPLGFVRALRPVGAMGTFNPGNLGMEITTTGTAPGNTEVKRRHRLVDLSGNYPSSVYRYFEVVPQFNVYFDATVKFRYFDGEVSPLTPGLILDLFRSTDQGGSWAAQGALHDIADRTIIKTGLPGFSWFAAGPGLGPLPVTLTHFDAACTQQGVALFWTTESEINNMHFRVERSENLLDWTEIAVVPGAGNSNEPLHYQINDNRPLNGLAYYRITQYDFDGESESFVPVSLVCNSDADGNTMLVYPNPAEDLFILSVYSTETISAANVNITDMSGKVMLARKVSLESGSNEFIFDRSGLRPGSYQIHLQSELSNLHPIKIIVK